MRLYKMRSFLKKIIEAWTVNHPPLQTYKLSYKLKLQLAVEFERRDILHNEMWKIVNSLTRIEKKKKKETLEEGFSSKKEEYSISISPFLNTILLTIRVSQLSKTTRLEVSPNKPTITTIIRGKIRSIDSPPPVSARDLIDLRAEIRVDGSTISRSWSFDRA